MRTTYDVEDTIAAIASPLGAGGRGIIRLSGPATLPCLQAHFCPQHGSLEDLVGPAMQDGHWQLASAAAVLP
ncbi:MAG: hypothetical protein KDA37_03420 [Planctomycetales bacterium]|nr:hypothetical protein [Planctomycetales bacterium]